MATKLSATDFIYNEIQRKKKYATEKIRSNKNRSKNEMAVLETVLYQIEVCEELRIPLKEEQIDEWLCCRNEWQVARKASSWKFAQLRKE